MKYYIIAGEASGDLHGSNLIKSLKNLDNQAVIHAWGGDMMATEGAVLRKHYRDLAFMGFLEVVKNLRTIARNLAFCKKDILDFQPDVVIFIDYPGFNLRIAKWAKANGLKTFYYISPQIWAWHTSRVHGIKKVVDKMFCILPFEKDFYQQFDYAVDFVGHPLLDVVADAKKQPLDDFKQQNGLDERPIIALLPGSRRQEIEKMLSLMLTVVPYFKGYQFVVAAASALPLSFYAEFLKNTEGEQNHDSFGKGVKIIQNDTYKLLQLSTAALVKSGTSTLETALFGVPEVVCYKGSKFSYAIAKRVIKVKYISLVNLISDRKIVKELIQDELTTENLVRELQQAIDNQQIIKKDYEILRGLLGNAGASDKTAELMYRYLKA